MPSHRKRLPLQLKVTVVLVAIVMVPLGVAAYLVDQLGKTAANVASSDASARVVAMEQAIDRYHQLVDMTKRLHAEVAGRLAQAPAIAALDPRADLQANVDATRCELLFFVATDKFNVGGLHFANTVIS